MRLAFFGSPPYAVPALRELAQRHEVALVVAQPDKPVGRGLKRTAPAVAKEASRLDLPLAQPARLRGNDEFRQQLQELGCEVAITVAYGKILPPELLAVPRAGFLNAHASLLPKYRGAAPIQWAIVNGERETGVSVMRTEAGLDTGPVCLVERTPIGPAETAPELFERLSLMSGSALLAALALLESGDLECRPQDHSQATLARQLRKEDGNIDWCAPALSIYNRYRGLVDWPGVNFTWAGKTVRVREMTMGEMTMGTGGGQPGEVVAVGSAGITVAVGEGAVTLVRVQVEGKATVAARDWANGYGVREGVVLA